MGNTKYVRKAKMTKCEKCGVAISLFRYNPNMGAASELCVECRMKDKKYINDSVKKGLKLCTKCKYYKPIWMYYDSGITKDGKHDVCTECVHMDISVSTDVARGYRKWS